MATESEGALPTLNNGKSVSLGNSEIIFRVSGKETGGAYSVLDYLAGPGAGSPSHVHYNEDESFFILEGSMTFQLGEEKVRATPGTFIKIERGLRHAFVNAEAEPARSMIILTPSGLEYFFWELSEMGKSYPGGLPNELFQALTAKYNLDFNPAQA